MSYYHNPSLKKLIREPKNGNRIMVQNSLDVGQCYFSNAHWLVKLFSDMVPVALAGFLPRGEDETTGGYFWDEIGRRTPGPDMSGIIPKNPGGGDVLTDTRWGHWEDDQRTTLLQTESGRSVFVNADYWGQLNKLFSGVGDLDYTQDGEGSSVNAYITGTHDLAFLLMPLNRSAADVDFPAGSTGEQK